MKFQLTRNIISLIIALVLGAVAVVLVNFYLAKEKARIEAEKESKLGKFVIVVVAAKDISRGTKITASMLKTEKIREATLQPRAISSIDSAVNKVAIADIISGEQVSFTKLMSGAMQGSGKEPSGVTSSGLAMKIPAGKRTFTISIDHIAAAGGMLKPNDYVDVIGIFPYTQSIEGKNVTQNVSVTLFQNILVLAVGAQSSPSAEAQPQASLKGATTITLALTPQQTELFNIAQDMGKLRLVLRPPLETTINSLPPVTGEVLWQQILTQAGMQLPQKEVATKEEPVATVEVYRGKEKEVVPLK
jgi:pilus assembly protein CpaB